MEQKNICQLFVGGHCPVCDDEWEILGISPKEAEEINRECCENSYFPFWEENCNEE